MIRTLTLATIAALALALVGCDSSTATAPVDQPIPTGSQAPRTVVEVIAGTKENPADTPIVKVTWWHTDSILNMNFSARGPGTNFSYWDKFVSKGELSRFNVPSDSYTIKIPACTDSVLVYSNIEARALHEAFDKIWVYCRH